MNKNLFRLLYINFIFLLAYTTVKVVEINNIYTNVGITNVNYRLRGNTPAWLTKDHERLLKAIAFVESNNDSDAVGDEGRSLGTFQIGRAYYQDALEHSPNLRSFGLSYQDVVLDWYARLVVISYWDRYGSQHGYSIEGLARQHVAGPEGFHRESSLPYWKKIKNQLK